MDFMYSVYPCSVETSKGSILVLWSFYTPFSLCPFETKRGGLLVFYIGYILDKTKTLYVMVAF
jgi:hypothetical protein